MIKYLNTMLKDISMMIDISQNGEIIQLWLKNGCQSLENNILTVHDNVENKLYLIDGNKFTLNRIITYKCGVWPDSVSLYEDYVSNNTENIIENNKWFDDECDKIFNCIAHIDSTFKNIQLLKTNLISYRVQLAQMKLFGITDLFSYVNCTTTNFELANQLCQSYYDKLKNTVAEAIDKLQIEKNTFIEINDTESIEEIDIIIDMITNSIDNTQYDNVLSGDIVYLTMGDLIDDMRKNWPAILLPVPF